MVKITLPTFVDFMAATGTVRVTQVRTAKIQHLSAEDHRKIDHYIHLRRPLMDALDSGLPGPLVSCLNSLQDPKKVANYKAIVAGMTKFLAKHDFEVHQIHRRQWRHGDLTVSVTPTARLWMDDAWHVAFVYLKAEPLTARSAAPILHLLQLSHGQLGSPLIIEARTGKVYRPSKSARMLRGLGPLLEGEAEAFVRLWNGNLEAT